MNNYKKTKVVMLPTEKASFIYLIKDKNKLLFDKDSNTNQLPNQNNVINQHLYFLSNEEIKEGDCVYVTNETKSFIHKTSHKDAIGWIMIGDYKFDQTYSYTKIISSTDKSLGLPRPSDSFIKKYCELGGIDEVMVEYIQTNIIDWKTDEKELILKVAPDNTITIKPVKDSWNREELYQLLNKSIIDELYRLTPDQRVKWIEDNL